MSGMNSWLELQLNTNDDMQTDEMLLFVAD